jgi:hypothetical protein
MLRAIRLLVATSTVALTGCWHAPIATVQPAGPPRVIEDSISVESRWLPVKVQAVDADKRNLDLLAPGESVPIRFSGALAARNLEHVQPGNELRAILQRNLTIYVSTDRRLPVTGASPGTIVSGARVLEVDPSYRLLTLQFIDGLKETLKVHRGVKLAEMEPGDDVAIRTTRVIDVRPGSR